MQKTQSELEKWYEVQKWQRRNAMSSSKAFDTLQLDQIKSTAFNYDNKILGKDYLFCL